MTATQKRPSKNTECGYVDFLHIYYTAEADWLIKIYYVCTHTTMTICNEINRRSKKESQFFIKQVFATRNFQEGHNKETKHYC